MDAPLAGLLAADPIQNIAILCADGSWGGGRPRMAAYVTLTATKEGATVAGCRVCRRCDSAMVGARAADGFDIMPPVLPSGLEAFVDHVVPIIQRRGLPRPPNCNQERALEGAA